MNISYNISNNAIVNHIITDPSTGKVTYSPVNTDGVRSWNFWEAGIKAVVLRALVMV